VNKKWNSDVVVDWSIELYRF